MTVTTLTAAVGRYPATAPVLDGAITSKLLAFDFQAIQPINRAFAPMVNDLRFDVSEMAIGTFLQARAAGIDIVLLPVVVAARFQEQALLCRADDTSIRGPMDLTGKRIGVRAYAQTTGMWLRGVMLERYGLRADEVRWIIFEDAHVHSYRDPAWVERGGGDLLELLKDGTVDAIIVGNDMPDADWIRPVFPDVEEAASWFRQQHGFVPGNHFITVSGALARSRRDLLTEIASMFRAAKAMTTGDTSALLMDRRAIAPVLELADRYSFEQALIDARLTIEDLWQPLPEPKQ